MDVCNTNAQNTVVRVVVCGEEEKRMMKTRTCTRAVLCNTRTGTWCRSSSMQIGGKTRVDQKNTVVEERKNHHYLLLFFIICVTIEQQITLNKTISHRLV